MTTPARPTLQAAKPAPWDRCANPTTPGTPKQPKSPESPPSRLAERISVPDVGVDRPPGRCAGAKSALCDRN